MSKISSGAIMLAFIAVLIGLVGAYMVREVLRRPRAERPRGAQKVTVPMASMSLKAGRTVSLGDVALAKMTRAEMKERGISRAFMTDTKQIIGRVLQKDMKRGERFDTTLFYPDGMRPGLVERLEPGMRAVTISVGTGNALLGFAGPGNWVDVLFRSGAASNGGAGGDSRYVGYDINSDRYDRNPAWRDYSLYYSKWRGGSVRLGDDAHDGFVDHRGAMEQTITLLERIQVLAIDRETFEGISVESEQSERMAVTLAVTPEQATSLRVVDGRGELSLTLRNPDDDDVSEDGSPRTLKDILEFPEIAAVTRPERNDMEVYRGFRKSHIDFVGSGIDTRRYDRRAFDYRDDLKAVDDNDAAIKAEKNITSGQPTSKEMTTLPQPSRQ